MQFAQNSSLTSFSDAVKTTDINREFKTAAGKGGLIRLCQSYVSIKIDGCTAFGTVMIWPNAPLSMDVPEPCLSMDLLCKK